MKVRFIVWVFLLVSCITCMTYYFRASGSSKNPAHHQIPERYQNAAKNVALYGDFYRQPVISPSGAELAYMRNARGGRTLFTLNMVNHHGTKWPIDGEPLQLGGYSPNGEYLLVAYHGKGADQVAVLDRNHSVIYKAECSIDGPVMWSGESSFIIADYNSHHIARLSPESNKWTSKVLDIGLKPSAMTVAGSNTLGIIDTSRLSLVDMNSGEMNDLIHFTNAMFASWGYLYPPDSLAYSPEKNTFLFCAWDSSLWRHVYQVQEKSNTWSIRQCASGDESCYHCRWLRHGNGYSYIANRSNHWSLAVHLPLEHFDTNLFIYGNVYSYAVSSDGETIYALASTNVEPLGAWEYKIAEKRLRNIEPEDAGNVPTPALASEEKWAVAEDGERVPFYHVKPAILQAAHASPAIIAIPIPTKPFVPGWNMVGQYFASVGVHYCAVNCRGTDGYGRLYSQLPHSSGYKDISAVYSLLIKDPQVDSRQIFLMSFSGGMHIVNDAVAHYPRRWAGVVDMSGPPPPMDKSLLMNTKVFLFRGKDDSIQEEDSFRNFTTWAARKRINVETLYPEHVGHSITDTAIEEQLLASLGYFIFGDTRSTL